MSNALIGTGILLKSGNGAGPEVFTDIAEIVALKPPALSRNEIEVSNHNEGVEAKILGMLRQGQVTGTLNWIPGNGTHAALIADLLANTKRNWQIAFPSPDDDTWTFAGRIQLFDIPEQGVDSALQAQFALTLDGAITMEADT
jgi:hypothetical protein